MAGIYFTAETLLKDFTKRKAVEFKERRVGDFSTLPKRGRCMGTLVSPFRLFDSLSQLIKFVASNGGGQKMYSAQLEKVHVSKIQMWYRL